MQELNMVEVERVGAAGGLGDIVLGYIVGKVIDVVLANQEKSGATYAEDRGPGAWG